MRIATLNLWGWFGDWPARRERLRRAWDDVAADVLLVQEAAVTEGRDQVAETAEALGYAHVARAGCHHGLMGSEGLGLLAHEPLEASGVVELPASVPSRCVLTATLCSGVQIATGHVVVGPQELRNSQIDAILAMLRGPAVVGGDFNADPHEVHDLAAAYGFADTLDGAGVPTWPTSHDQFARAWEERLGAPPAFPIEPRRVDYVLTRGVEVVRSGVRPLGDAPDRYVWTTPWCGRISSPERGARRAAAAPRRRRRCTPGRASSSARVARRARRAP